MFHCPRGTQGGPHMRRWGRGSAIAARWAAYGSQGGPHMRRWGQKPNRSDDRQARCAHASTGAGLNCSSCSPPRPRSGCRMPSWLGSYGGRGRSLQTVCNLPTVRHSSELKPLGSMSKSGEERRRSPETDLDERRGTEDRIQLIIDTTPALLHSAVPEGSLDYLNQGWLTFLGVPLEEVLGWRWTRFIHAEDREAFVAKWREALATGEPFEAESRVRQGMDNIAGFCTAKCRSATRAAPS